MENQNQEFAYESKDIKRKRISKLFLAEVLLLGIIGIVIVGALFYLKVINIPPFVSSYFRLVGNEQVVIVTASEISGYQLESANEGELINLLSEWGVLAGVYPESIYKEGYLSGTSVKKITFILTDKLQNANRYSENNGESFYSSSFVRLKNEEMQVYIHVDKAFLGRIKPEEIKYLVQVQVISVLYKMMARVSNPEQIKARDAQINSIHTKLIKENKFLFNIRKK